MDIRTVVVGAGQAGLAASHALAVRGVPHVVLEAGPRVGESWRQRWDSLRLFTPAGYDGLPGLPFPGDPWALPSKDELADYLAGYARAFDLPVRTGVRVDRLSRSGDDLVVEWEGGSLRARDVIIASGFDRIPTVPAFAAELDPGIVQLDASAYRAPHQVPPGDVLVVGAGNSGADLALELAATHAVALSGRHPGELPWRPDTAAARPLSRLAFWAFGHLLTVGTPAGRRARDAVLHHGGPLIRVKSRDLAAAGVVRVPRVVGVRDGLPVLADGRALSPATVLWCTGFRPDHSWIDLPVLDERGAAVHDRGLTDEPGLAFVGLRFQRSLASSMIHGVGRDAEHVVERLLRRDVAAPLARPAPGR